jgi:hypothetical protein
MRSENKFPGVPNSSNDSLALHAEEMLNRELNVPMDQGVVIRVIKEGEHYFVSEWIASDQANSKQALDLSVARICLVGDLWTVMSMDKDAGWRDLGDKYRGSFDHCLEMIIEDPEYHFWG